MVNGITLYHQGLILNEPVIFALLLTMLPIKSKSLFEIFLEAKN